MDGTHTRYPSTSGSMWWPFQHTTLLLFLLLTRRLVLLVSLFLFLCCCHNYWLLWKCMGYTLHYRTLLYGRGHGTVCCKSPLSKETEAARIFPPTVISNILQPEFIKFDYTQIHPHETTLLLAKCFHQKSGKISFIIHVRCGYPWLKGVTVRYPSVSKSI